MMWHFQIKSGWKSTGSHFFPSFHCLQPGVPWHILLTQLSWLCPCSCAVNRDVWTRQLCWLSMLCGQHLLTCKNFSGAVMGRSAWSCPRADPVVSAKGTESLPMSCPPLDSQEAKNTKLVDRCYFGGSVFPPALALLVCVAIFFPVMIRIALYVSL